MRAVRAFITVTLMSFALLSFLRVQSVSAATLETQISDFMHRMITIPSAKVQVKLKTDPARLQQCDNPQFSLPPTKRVGGRLSLRMQCGDKRFFIPVEVQVTARYPVAMRAIPANHKIGADDIGWREGRLDTFSQLPLLDINKIKDSVTLRPVGAGQMFTERMLRMPLAITAGQTVQVTITGDGFSISNQGKALNNAVLKEKVRVRMDSGQIVEGVVVGKGEVSIAM